VTRSLPPFGFSRVRVRALGTVVLLLVLSSAVRVARATPDAGPASTTVQSGARPAADAGEGRSVGAVAESVWDHVLFRISDRPLTVGQLVLTLCLVLVGMWLIRLLSRLVGRRLSRSAHLDGTAVSLVRRLLTYVLGAVLAFLALDMLRLPLATFAFLAGAAALGIGFGAQRIVADFMSGLVLMIERPVRIGDLIEIGPQLGRVERIGARATRVRRVDGVDVLIPNSKLLDENVTNWTLSDKRIRTSVTVGVAYGSPSERVATLLEQALAASTGVLREPAAMVLFQDFGDSSLVFEAFFWVEVTQPMDARQVRSDLRHRIATLFREAGITIAFPQRDVHLDAAAPIPVQVVVDRGDEPPALRREAGMRNDARDPAGSGR
jgi:potassium efflux system protein